MPATVRILALTWERMKKHQRVLTRGGVCHIISLKVSLWLPFRLKKQQRSRDVTRDCSWKPVILIQEKGQGSFHLYHYTGRDQKWGSLDIFLTQQILLMDQKQPVRGSVRDNPKV